MNLYAYEYFNLLTNSKNYPVVELEGFLVNNGKPVNIEDSGLKLTESGLERSITGLECQNTTLKDTAFSLLFVLDISKSMEAKNIGLIRQAFTEFLNEFDLKNSEIAFSGFNNENYLLQDFTNNIQDLSNSLNNLPFGGSTDLNAAFINESASALKIIQSARNRKEIILITDGSETGNRNEIIQELLKTGARVHSITINFAASAMIKSIVSSTKGYIFDSIKDAESLKNIFMSLAYLFRYSTPCKITYKSFSCDTQVNVNLSFETYNYNTSFFYKINENQIPYIKFEPEYFNYGVKEPPSKPIRKFNLTAVNGDIQIDSFIDSPKFKVISEPKNFLLKMGETREISVQYLPSDTNYVYGEIKVTGNQCKGGLLRLAGGSDRTNIIENTIRVVKPNGGEILFTEGFYNIQWEGVLPTDTVQIDYSIDGGNNWINITNSATGLNYYWLGIPKTASNNCLIRISQLSKYDLSKNIISLKGIQAKVVSLVWRDDKNEIYTGSTDGFIRQWNATTGEPIKSLIQNIPNLKDFDLSSDFNYIIYASSGSDKIKIRNHNNEFAEDTITIPGEEITCIDWNPVNDFYIVGCESGKIYIFDFPSDLPSKIIPGTSEIKTITWDKSGNIFAAGLVNGFIKIINSSGELVKEFKASDQQINSVTFNPTGGFIANSSMSEIIKIWDVENSTNINSLNNLFKPVNTVSWDPAAKFIASASVDSAVVLWNPGSGDIYYTFKQHNNKINNIKWRDDGKRIASSTIQGQVFIWSPDDIPFNRPTLQLDVSDAVWSIINPDIKSKNVTFMPVLKNRFADSTITEILYNNNLHEILIDTIFIKGGSISFRIISGLPEFPFKLNGKSSFDLKIRFNPLTLGNKIDSVIFKSGNKEFHSLLFGFVREPVIEVTPQNHDFGIVKVGGTSDEFIINIKNISTDEQVYLDSIKILNNSGSQFELSEFPKGLLQPDEVKQLKAVFKPTAFFMQSSIFDVIYDGQISPEYLSFIGTGAAPQIKFPHEIIFDKIICENHSAKVITIYNTGNEILKILGIEKTQDTPPEFTLDLTGTSFNIKEKDSTKFIIIFDSENSGDFEGKIKIISEINADKTTENIINIKASKSKYGINLSQNNISFFVFNINEPQTKQFKINNTGTEAIVWTTPIDFKYFVIESIVPEITLPGEYSIVTVRFKGAPANGLFTDEFQYTDPCGIITKLKLTAYVGPNSAEIKSDDKITFPEIKCIKDSSFFSLKIENTGSTPLLLNSAEFLPKNDVFSVVGNIEGITIPAGENYSIQFKFKPNQNGKNSGNLRIYTNAVNVTDGVKIIELNGFWAVAEFEFSQPFIELRNIISGEKFSSSFEINNTGSMDLIWDFSKIYNHFIVDSISPAVTPTGGNSKVYFTFQGGNQEEYFSEFLKFSTLCDKTDSIEIRAFIDGNIQAGIKAGKIYAQPGDTIELPIYLISPDNSELPDVSGYTAQLEYNSTLLVPLDVNTGFVSNGIRYITVNLPPKPIQSDGEVYRIKFLATLGNADSTEITVTNSKAVDNPDIKIFEENGFFGLDSLCLQGGERLIGFTGVLKLSQNMPNPVTGSSIIHFFPIENGLHELVVYDLKGNEVKKLYSQIIKPIAEGYQVEFRLDELPVGNYIYSLITPSQQLTKKMTVTR